MVVRIPVGVITNLHYNFVVAKPLVCIKHLSQKLSIYWREIDNLDYFSWRIPLQMLSESRLGRGALMQPKGGNSACSSMSNEIFFLWYISKPIWILSCLTRLTLCTNDLLQMSHWNSFSLVWILLCVSQLLFCANSCLQISHWNGFSPVWVLVCQTRTCFCDIYQFQYEFFRV